MNKRFWIGAGVALVVTIAIAIVLLARPSSEPEHPARVIETENKVDAHPRPDDDWRPAVVDMLIFGGGRVRTGAVSSARLELLDGIVRLSADSIFTVKKSTTHQGELVTTLFVEQGRLWAHLTSDQPHEFTVETNNAVAAVRDTRFSVNVAGEVTLLSVAEGQVILTAQEQSVTVAAEQQSTVVGAQPPSPPEPMSDEERKLWATEGEMPDLAPPLQEGLSVDVSCSLIGPAGDPASRNPETVFDVTLTDIEAVQVAVETPDGETIAIPAYGDLYGQERRFHLRIPGLPQAGGTYTFKALGADGMPIPGAVASDVYLGGHELDPPVNVQVQVTEAGLLVTWDPVPVIPGAFDPSGSPHSGFYQMTLSGGETATEFGWNNVGMRLAETSHLIPFRHQDFGPGDRGAALDEMENGEYYLSLMSFSVPPEGTAAYANECSASDPAEEIRIVVQDGRVQVAER
jgi:hypothetical protein